MSHISPSAAKANRGADLRAKREELRALKDVPCADCGGRYPPECMDFDHLPDRGPKEFRISRALYRAGRERIAAEVAKCEVVCANCHRIRTRIRSDQETP